MKVDRQRFEELAAGQFGVISRAQAMLCGYTASGVKVRLASREWVSVLPGIYRISLVPMSATALVYSAALWAGPGSVVGGAAALWWWGLTEDKPSTVMVYVPRPRTLLNRAGVVVARRRLPAEDQATHRRVRVAALPFAALFGSVALGARGQRVLDRALLRSVSLRDAQSALERNRCMEGSAQARRWLKAAADGSAAESERRFAELLRTAGITGWQVNRVHRFAGGPLMPDFLFTDAALVVEIDGWAFHSDPVAFDGDRSRQNRIVLSGWRVLRFTWRQLQDEPDQVIDQVRAALWLQVSQ